MMNLSVRLKRIITFGLCILIFLGANAESVKANDIPYDTYNYDYREYIHYTPAAYIPAGNISTLDMMLEDGTPVGMLNNPQDMCIAPNGDVYICDSGNNRIVVMDNQMSKCLKIIETFDNNGKEDKFKQPTGVCVSENEQLFVADSQNRRVVVFDLEGNYIKKIDNPQSESLEDNYVFTPLKVTVDYADRVYVIASGMFEGIMVFESNGEFASFFGTIDVQISLWEKFWKRLATKEERSNQKLFIPTEFTGLDIDPDGFVYATNISTDGIQGVRRLNPKGEDVIKKGQNKNVGGDLWIDGSSDYSGPSQFTDVVYRENGIYSCLDRKRGRVFTYDHEGNLLYIFGGLGSQEGTFQLPTAIEDIGGRLVVLDATKGEIICFEETEYGRVINDAVALRYDGDEASAVQLWQRVLELDENNELANTGIGKAYLTSGDYENAMKYLKLGMNRDYYSIAYRRYRNGILTENVGFFLTGIVVLIIAIAVFRKVRRKRKGEIADE